MSAGKVAKVVAFCGLTFGFGLTAVGAFGLLVAPGTAAAMIGVPVEVVLASAIALILPLPADFWRRCPAAAAEDRTFLGGAAVGRDDAGAVPYRDGRCGPGRGRSLCPAARRSAVSFPVFLSIYSAALVVGVVSHVPGGIGVFETLILLGLSDAGSHPQPAACWAPCWSFESSITCCR